MKIQLYRELKLRLAIEVLTGDAERESGQDNKHVREQKPYQYLADIGVWLVWT